MISLPRLLVVLSLGLACASPLGAQDKKNLTEEDSRLNRVIEHWLEMNETEREHVAREVARAGNGKVDDDFGDWFYRLGGDQAGWDRARIKRNNAAAIFDRIAQHFMVDGTVITRGEFLRYARQFWRKDQSPRWREGAAFDASSEAQRLFKRLDQDRDGYLGKDELPTMLADDLPRWDQNRDGLINQDEYRAYFVRRLNHLYRAWQQRVDRPLPPLATDVVDDERPMVARAERLPPGLPGWFEPIDRDGDGQLAIFEWRRAGWTIDEFSRLDLNRDGLLEPREILRVVSIIDRDGSRPFAYLFQKRAP